MEKSDMYGKLTSEIPKSSGLDGLKDYLIVS